SSPNTPPPLLPTTSPHPRSGTASSHSSHSPHPVHTAPPSLQPSLHTPSPLLLLLCKSLPSLLPALSSLPRPAHTPPHALTASPAAPSSLSSLPSPFFPPLFPPLFPP